jgi:innexin
MGMINLNSRFVNFKNNSQVPFVLFGQAIFFYLPHLFWRLWENGKIKILVEGLQRAILSRYVQREEDLQVNKNYVIYAKPTIIKKVVKFDTNK